MTHPSSADLMSRRRSIVQDAAGLPLPASGATLERWERLCALTAADVSHGRLVEAHADAVAILTEIEGAYRPPEGADTDAAVWGVWAAEPPEPRLLARRNGDGWLLSGRKLWCSGATLCTHALVTAQVVADPPQPAVLPAADGRDNQAPHPGPGHRPNAGPAAAANPGPVAATADDGSGEPTGPTGPGHRPNAGPVAAAGPGPVAATADDGSDEPCEPTEPTELAGPRLFAVDLGHPGVQRPAPTWVNAGMAGTDTNPVDFDAVPARTVGDALSYLQRPGFWHGSVGVAACWLGAAHAAARPLQQRAGRDDPHLQVALGAVETALAAGRWALAGVAARYDADPRNERGDARLLAMQARAVIEAVATEVVHHVGRALGAGPLAMDAGHAANVADLTMYIRQSHGDADLATIGRLVATQPPS